MGVGLQIFSLLQGEPRTTSAMASRLHLGGKGFLDLFRTLNTECLPLLPFSFQQDDEAGPTFGFWVFQGFGPPQRAQEASPTLLATFLIGGGGGETSAC